MSLRAIFQPRVALVERDRGPDVERRRRRARSSRAALLNAIEKHDAWAAAISSSGLVRPLCSSVREAQVTGRRVNAPDET